MAEQVNKAGRTPMSFMKAKQEPIDLLEGRKSDVRTQFAALCYRQRKGKTQVLLITSRQTKRWIIPKGWPIDGKTPSESAMTEAWEEAGVIGKVFTQSLGLFSYSRYLPDGEEYPCVAMVYPIKVKSLADDYPETGQRDRRWFGRKRAAENVAEPELAHILKNFDSGLLKT